MNSLERFRPEQAPEPGWQLDEDRQERVSYWVDDDKFADAEQFAGFVRDRDRRDAEKVFSKAGMQYSESRGQLLLLYLDQLEVNMHREILKQCPEAATSEEQTFGVEETIAHLDRQHQHLASEVEQSAVPPPLRKDVQALARRVRPEFAWFTASEMQEGIADMADIGIETGAQFKLADSVDPSIAGETVVIEEVDRLSGRVVVSGGKLVERAVFSYKKLVAVNDAS